MQSTGHSSTQARSFTSTHGSEIIGHEDQTIESTRTYRVFPVRISEVATRAGIPATTLRYYESVGLVEAPRGMNGYRDYDDSVLERLAFIEAAKQLNMSLPEIADLLTVLESANCTGVREVLHPQLRQRLHEVDKSLANLRLLRNRLAAATRRVDACPDSGESCRFECVLLGHRQGSCTSPEDIREGSN